MSKKVNWKRFALAMGIFVLYLGISAGLVWLSYRMSPPTTSDQYKEFGVRAGLALTAVGALFGFIMSYFSLSTQIRAASDLEELKGKVTRQTNFLNQALNAKSVAYDKLFIASNNCYRELQNLTKGQFDKERVAECQRSLSEAEGLAAHLDEDDKQIVIDLVQAVFNMADAAEEVKVSGPEKKRAYNKVWEDHVTALADAMERLRSRSLFHEHNVRPKIINGE